MRKIIFVLAVMSVIILNWNENVYSRGKKKKDDNGQKLKMADRDEEFVKKARAEIERVMFEEGKKLCHAVKVFNLPREIMQTLGQFKYRFSYGQNMIAHTLEETKIGIKLANEIKADVNVVRLGCLLHDIGKVITDEEGSHVELGVKYLKRFNIPQPVIDCVAQHHEDEAISSKESALVYIADAISGSRPGARYENYEEYVTRLQKLEEIATSFKGVKEAYAIQAGREVRVIVNPKELTDDQTTKLAHDLKVKIEKEMTYPGTVKVTVVRELRVSDVAK
jgi:ribonuclease Y